MSDHFGPVNEYPVQKIIIEVRDLSLDQATPQFAAAIDAQIDRDDASDDFIKEELHASIRSSSTDSMTSPYGSSIGRAAAVIALAPLSLVCANLILVQLQG
jgi:hypothetical protein